MRLVVNKKDVLTLTIGFLYFAVGDVSRLFGLFGLPREITYGLFFVLLIMFAVQRINMIRTYDAIIMFVILVVSIVGTLMYSQYISSVTSKLAPLLIFTPSYFFFRMYDYERLESLFESAAKFSGIFLLLYYYFVIRNTGVYYSMSYAYWISFPIVCFAGLYIRKRKLAHLVLGLVMLFTLVVAGCRGALLLTGVCILYLILAEILKKGSSTKIIVLVAAIGILVLAIIYFSDTILAYLSQFSGSSRSIKMLLNGELLESRTRDRIHELCKDLIDQNSLGYGPLASRKLLMGHNYPHSFWYELQLDYGLIPGIMVFVFVMFMGISNLIRYRNNNENIIVAFITIIGLGSLMVSSSYFYEMYVPATIAMYINWNSHYRKNNSANAEMKR